MSDSASSGAIEHNLGKNSPIKSLFQPTLGLNPTQTASDTMGESACPSTCDFTVATVDPSLSQAAFA